MMLITNIIANDSPGLFYGYLVRCPEIGTFSPLYPMASSSEAKAFSDSFYAIVTVPPCRLYLHSLTEFIATAAQIAFTMVSKAGETDPEYTRVYVDNIELASTDIAVSGATPAEVTIPACTAGQVVQVYMPKTRNGAYSVQQAIQMQVSTKTIEIVELGNDAVTVDVVQIHNFLLIRNHLWIWKKLKRGKLNGSSYTKGKIHKNP